MNILINTPDPNEGGGVTTYCRVVKPHFSSRVTYFWVKRSRSLGGILSLFNLASGFVRYVLEIGNKEIELVHLNPSLGYKAVLRDALFLLLAKAMGRKVIVFFHGWDEECERMIRRYFLLPFRTVYTCADAVIVLSSTFRNKLVIMGVGANVLVETTTVDAEILRHAETAVSERISHCGHKNFRLLFLARMEKEKGIYEALEAYQLLKERQQQLTLTVVGDGSELEKVRKHIVRHGIPDVELAGYRTGEALRRSYANADAYLFPTRHGEGFPISIIEAMAYGLPVLTTAVGGIPDFFEDGKMGFLIDASDPHKSASLLEDLIMHPELCFRIGKYNHQYVQRHLAPEKVVGRLEKIYTAVLAAS